ncbi:MAG TPA: CoA transferase [Gaiellaceae bacterium]|nr:CoA transferase [Gaiellaceae bacterium]
MPDSRRGVDLSAGPLGDVRVLDLGHVVAGPFAGSLLGDLGADVIKVEEPVHGDTIRVLGPQADGHPLWWKVSGRNKRSLALDLRTEAGREIIVRLAESVDVLIENFRAGTFERWGIGSEYLLERNPRLIMLRISGYGQGAGGTGRPGYGRVGEAVSGAVNLTGESDGKPLHVGFSLGDATTGLMGTIGILAALHARDLTGRGQVIDLALFESLFRMIEWQIPLAQKLGQVIRRRGNVFPIGYAVGGSFQAADGRWLTISTATAGAISRLLRVVGGEEMERDPDFADFEARTKPGNMERIDRKIGEWVGRYTAEEAISRLEAEDIVVSLVYDATMMMEDSLIAEREDIVEFDDPDIGAIKMPGVVPKLSETPGSIRSSGARLGQHTAEILGEILGMSGPELDELERQGVIRRDGSAG